MLYVRESRRMHDEFPGKYYTECKKTEIRTAEY